MDFQKLKKLLDEGITINENADENDVQVYFRLKNKKRALSFTPEKYKNEEELAEKINKTVREY